MCSLGGWYCFGKARPHPEVLKGILLAGRENGNKGSKDATGIAWRAPDGTITLRKHHQDSPEFIKEIPDEKWAEISKSPLGLLHNRAVTKGKASDNANNHPIDAYGWVVTHNGTLANDEDVFYYHKETRPCEVDSVAINMLLSRQPNYPECFRELTVLSGGCTAAMWKVSAPENLALVRLGPNELFLWEHRDVIYWSSTPLAASALPYKAFASLVFQNTSRLPEDRLLVMTPEKVRSFALSRSPFFYPIKVKSASSQTGSESAAGSSSQEKDSPGSSPSSTGTGAVLSEAETKSFIWKGTGRVTLPSHTIPILKPAAIVEEMVPEWDNLYRLIKETRERHKPGTESKEFTPGKTTVRTGYGTWYFESQPVALPSGLTIIVRREFTPAKRQKPFLYEVFGTSFPRLPIPKADSGTPYDKILLLEQFNIKSVNEHHVSSLAYGYMCPVCGAKETVSAWTNNLMRCYFCGIQSRLGVS